MEQLQKLGILLIITGLISIGFIIYEAYGYEISDTKLDSSEWITYQKLYQCSDGNLFSIYIQLFKEDGSTYWQYTVLDEHLNELYFLDFFSYTQNDFYKFYNMFDTAITWLKVC